MDNTRTPGSKYLLVAVLGVIGGALMVGIATRALPKMMAQMMPLMMEQMRKNGANLPDN
jgi:hypothetical protein